MWLLWRHLLDHMTLATYLNNVAIVTVQIYIVKYKDWLKFFLYLLVYS